MKNYSLILFVFTASSSFAMENKKPTGLDTKKLFARLLEEQQKASAIDELEKTLVTMPTAETLTERFVSNNFADLAKGYWVKLALADLAKKELTLKNLFDEAESLINNYARDEKNPIMIDVMRTSRGTIIKVLLQDYTDLFKKADELKLVYEPAKYSMQSWN